MVTVATVISPHAYVSKHANIGEGTIVMHHVLINADASIGENCIINSKALIEHDAIIENFCHISTSAVINGGAIVKEGTFFGSNATCKEYEVFSKANLTAKRSERGISPMRWDEIVGSIATKDYKEDELI